jgi:hypothetical protein
MDGRRGVLERGSFCAPLFLLQSLLARSDFCRGRIPQPHRPARALATKRAALHMPTDRSGKITLSIYYASGPSALCLGPRPSWPTRDSTFDRSRRKTKCRDHNDLFCFVAEPLALPAVLETRGGWTGRELSSAVERAEQGCCLYTMMCVCGGVAGGGGSCLPKKLKTIKCSVNVFETLGFCIGRI